VLSTSFHLDSHLGVALELAGAVMLLLAAIWFFVIACLFNEGALRILIPD